MGFRKFEILVSWIAVLQWSSSVSAEVREDFEKELGKLFLMQKITQSESAQIFASAKESYAALKNYEIEKDGLDQQESLTKLRNFTVQIIRDLKQENMNLFELFRNINSYLKDNTKLTTNTEMEMESLKRAVQAVLSAVERKLTEHYGTSSCNRHNVESILSLKETSLESVFRKYPSPTDLGLFFLEVFATIVGLSWGIISMIMAGK